jgi:hypothetical protein
VTGVCFAESVICYARPAATAKYRGFAKKSQPAGRCQCVVSKDGSNEPLMKKG